MRNILAALALATLSVPAFAQSPWSQPADAVPPKQTKFDLLNQSIEELLNDGYGIQAAAPPLVFLQKGAVRNQRSIWVACTLEVTDGIIQGSRSNLPPPSSRCFALN